MDQGHGDDGFENQMRELYQQSIKMGASNVFLARGDDISVAVKRRGRCSHIASRWTNRCDRVCAAVRKSIGWPRFSACRGAVRPGL